MDHMILGILLINSMSLYELRGFIQKNLNSFCSDSIGSIQAALKKLVNNKEVTCVESYEHGVIKKIFSITDVGSEKFKTWISSPVNVSKSHNMEGSKLFFLGMADSKTRLQMLETYRDDLLKEQKYLQQISAFIAATQDGVIENNVKRYEADQRLCDYLKKVADSQKLEEIIANIYRYQLCTLEYGQKKCEFDIAWVQEMINREKKERGEE